MTDVAKMQSHNSAKNTKRRALTAKRFGKNTCPASRHAMMIAESIERGDSFWCDCKEDAEHASASLYSVLESLWKARTRIAKLEGK